jgi:hypothetical protein
MRPQAGFTPLSQWGCRLFLRQGAVLVLALTSETSHAANFFLPRGSHDPHILRTILVMVPLLMIMMTVQMLNRKGL